MTMNQPSATSSTVRNMKACIRTELMAALALLLGCIGTTAYGLHPEIPGADPKRPVALVGATIHPVTAEPITGGTLIFERGKITAIGKDLELPADAIVIDVAGKHIYPGWLDADTDIGLTEISAVRATRDQREAGRINPNVKAQVAFNPDSELIPVARANGVLLCQTAPAGSLLRGMSAVMMLDGWTWEDMTLRSPAALHITWPRVDSPTSVDGSRGSRRDTSQSTASRPSPLEELEGAFADAKRYREARRLGNQYPRDARWDAMIPVLERRVPVIAHADRAADIESAIAFSARHQLRLIIAGGFDALECRELLLQHKVPVIVKAVYRLPRHRDDPFDSAYTLPARLHRAGIPFCIAGFGSTNAANVRNLPYHAATAVAYGLPREEAIRAISLYPAQILGVSHRVGSLQIGKDATLIVCNGDPLEVPTQVERAFIAGRPVDLNSRHTRLWNKYREKYRRKGLLKEGS